MKRLAVVSIALGLFTARPLLNQLMRDPTPALVLLFGGLLVLAVAWPVAGAPAPERATALIVLGIGVLAFVAGRALAGGHAPAPPTFRVLGLAALAAIAEEAFFRRLVFDVLTPGGAALSVVGSASLFAVAHVTVYGWWVLPLDLAAGLVLSWQRWASGRWSVPAVTHVIANVLVLL